MFGAWNTGYAQGARLQHTSPLEEIWEKILSLGTKEERAAALERFRQIGMASVRRMISNRLHKCHRKT